MHIIILAVLILANIAFAFPSSPANGDYWQQDGARFKYSSTGKVWNKLGKVLYVSPFQYSSTQTEAGIQAALTAIGSSEEELVIDEEFDINNDITIPSNVKLRISGSGKLVIASGKTLTILGDFEAPKVKVFDGAGSVSYSNSAIVYPQWWGAVGDGNDANADTNRIAMQKAINSISTGKIIIEGNFYITTILGAGDGQNILTLKSNISFIGNGNLGSKIIIKASTGNYKSILFGDSLTNIEVNGIYFDHNSHNNTFSSKTEYEAQLRSTIRLGSITNGIFRANIIDNSDGVTSIYATGNSSNLKILENSWLNVGYNLGDYTYDVSTINVEGTGLDISDNYFAGYDWTAGSAFTAIEGHGSNIKIDGNNIIKYFVGINIPAPFATEDSKANIIVNNILETKRAGIFIFSSDILGHVTGYGADGLKISNNYIYIRNSLFDGLDTTEFNGISFYPFEQDLPIRNVLISDNFIKFDEESIAKSKSVQSNGIGVYKTTDFAEYTTNITIKNNIIINSLCAGIRMINGEFGDISVVGNKIINAGQGVDAAISAANKIGIQISGNSSGDIVGNILIKNNEIVDTFATSRLVYGIRLFEANVSTASYEIIDNYFQLDGTDISSFLYQYNVATNNLPPYIKASNANFVKPIFNTKVGSIVYDPVNRKTYYTVDTGTTWLEYTLPDYLLNAATGNEVAYSLLYTTNKLTSGNDTGLEIIQTDTSSPGTSMLIEAKVGASSKFSVTNGGELTAAGVSSDGAGKATCIKADGTLGTCTDTVGAGGTCTCS